MEKIYPASQLLGNTNDNNDRTSLSPSMGKGYIQGVQFKSGIQLTTADYTLQHPTILKYYAPPFPLPPSIAFGFRLSGWSRGYSASQKKCWEFRPGRAACACFPGLGDFTETTSTERVVRVFIHMDLERFYSLAEEEADALPPQMENLSTRTFYHEIPITPAMRATIFQIFNCSYQGWAKKFFLEGKVLELVAHKIGQIEAVDSRKPDTRPLTSTDVDRIREAARLLTNDMEKSPDLNQLARSVGMCRSKLHRCFRMVYGITPFEYMRNRRLEVAMDFLMEGRMNVTQAAYAVGYSSPSYFTKAFKKYFGHLPSEKSS
ncbi:helix-turn-helix transcriptional regulator [uncultured Desulfobacter sp.]|uniref:helix-turn-helix transcriptional regulator n=1 Tax=uncultured Desulfobacter sp. TaxID=240139 RepID=UPI00374786FB